MILRWKKYLEDLNWGWREVESGISNLECVVADYFLLKRALRGA